MVNQLNLVKYFIWTMSFKLTKNMMEVKEVIENTHMSEPQPLDRMVLLINTYLGMKKIMREWQMPVIIQVK
jgi:hypothetical protein